MYTYSGGEYGLRKYTGIYPALITPFKRGSGDLDLDRLEVLLELLLKTGIRGVLVNGTTGEAPHLTREERISTIRLAKNLCGDDKLVIAGVGGLSLKETIAYSMDAANEGVDALLISPPYYYKPSATALLEYYMQLKRKCKIPILLYNIPKLTGVEIPVDVIYKLVDGERVIGIKDSSCDMHYLMNIIYKIKGRGLIFCGCDAIIYQALASGADGAILASANLIPKEIVSIYALMQRGKFDDAYKIYMEIYPILDVVSKYGVVAVKRGFECMGIDMGISREPLNIYRDLPADELDRIKTLLATKWL